MRLGGEISVVDRKAQELATRIDRTHIAVWLGGLKPDKAVFATSDTLHLHDPKAKQHTEFTQYPTGLWYVTISRDQPFTDGSNRMLRIVRQYPLLPGAFGMGREQEYINIPHNGLQFLREGPEFPIQPFTLAEYEATLKLLPPSFREAPLELQKYLGK